MTATAANMAELEAALENLLATITRAEQAIQNSAGLSMIGQVAIVVDHMANISRADTRYRNARKAVGYVAA